MSPTTAATAPTDPRSQPSSDALTEAERCPECGSSELLQDARHGETVCAGCGLVLSEGAIDPGPEWRAFDQAQREKRARTGPARTVMRHDRGLGTQIGYASGGVSSQLKAQLSRLRKYHQRASYRPGADRGLAHALSEIDRIATALDLPDAVGQTAAQLYRRARKEDFLKGRSVEATTAATVYAAARIHRSPRQLEEVTGVARSEHSDVARTYRRMLKELDLPVPAITPSDLVPKICSELGLPGEIHTAARDLIQATDETRLSGKNPASIAGAAVYRAGLENGVHRTQKEVAKAAGITDVTLRARVKDLIPSKA